ncbi:MAG: NusG domain II-containing protein [Magnetococcales bacterium]|nr:NusG domain II-containing protein [Magnetococcales bacterium]
MKNLGFKFFSLLKKATYPADRWVMAISAIILIALVIQPHRAGDEVSIYKDNQLLMNLSLNSDSITPVEGRLGEVKIEVKDGQARLLEYSSLRLIGTKTGWIKNRGEIAVCVPCGILIQIKGDKKPATTEQKEKLFDGIAR